jgi:UDP-galactopyranose mutase
VREILIVGAGFAGSVLAQKFASSGHRVTVLEQRSHIGGNCYDFMDEQSVRQHLYGPHIFHTNSTQVSEYLSNYTKWMPYQHKVLGLIDGKLLPIPFNLTGIEACFPAHEANAIKGLLVSKYGMGSKVPILELRKNKDPLLSKLADFIYEKVFLHYTMKQWGQSPDEIDQAVTDRVPVNVSYDDRYFNDSFQMMPLQGYTAIFKKLLMHPSIKVELNVDACERIQLDPDKGTIAYNGSDFAGTLIYTGCIDRLFQYALGKLSYRSLDFDVQYKEGTYQPVTTVNYPTPVIEHAYTRITEYKHMMLSKPENTTIAIEYPMAYDRDGQKGNIPYYPIFTKESQNQYESYKELAKKIPQLTLVGRLAEYRYYNMDAIILRALEVFEELQDANG